MERLVVLIIMMLGCTATLYGCGSGGTTDTAGTSNSMNRCGGSEILDGVPEEPCGLCDSGTLVCNGLNALYCAGEMSNLNACNGCSDLGNLGTSCSADGKQPKCGTWECGGSDDVQCEDPGRNACQGCNMLAHPLGASCGQCGKYVCSGTDSVTCDDPGLNACGGCGALAHNPGASCGQCGKYECNGTQGVTCNDPGLNGCGGCAPLPAPGSDCGQCYGTYVCSGTNSVYCDDATWKSTFNPCKPNVQADPDKLIACLTVVLNGCNDTVVAPSALAGFEQLAAAHPTCFRDSLHWACEISANSSTCGPNPKGVEYMCNGSASICNPGMSCASAAAQCGGPSKPSQCGGGSWSSTNMLNCWSVYREAAHQCIDNEPWGNPCYPNGACNSSGQYACEEGLQAYTCVPDLPWPAAVACAAAMAALGAFSRRRQRVAAEPPAFGPRHG